MALLDDASALIEDYCGRELYRRDDETFEVWPDGSTVLRLPPRYLTSLTVASVDQGGTAVTDYTRTRAGLLREAGWGEELITVTGSWGYQTPPASLKAITCSEVIRWMAMEPGIESERIGEMETHYGGSDAGHALSSATECSLKPYRRKAAGTMALLREGPSLDLRGPDVISPC
ncbi:phage gp6-like head-tail connector protein [Streptomyces wuyuanensis]|uniref:phage gp6-like head-tail connector protein n=1 Tax=Streptomyces wuyuanensis TaxID=1196353 RepID=UPI0034266C14